jgi:hypothetical protein
MRRMTGASNDETRRNEETVRAWYRALQVANYGAALELVSDDVLVHVGGESGLAGDYQGADGLVSVATRIAELSGGTHRTELLDVIASRRYAVARPDGQRRATQPASR